MNAKASNGGKSMGILDVPDVEVAIATVAHVGNDVIATNDDA